MSHWMNRPATVTVYSFKVFDPASRDMQVADRKATLEVIGHLSLAEPVPGTGEEVPPHALDGRGCYRRVATGWGALD